MLSDKQRHGLAELVVDKIALRPALTEALEQWPDDWLEKSLDMEEFKALCMKAALAQGDERLLKEARKYASEKDVQRKISDGQPSAIAINFGRL